MRKGAKMVLVHDNSDFYLVEWFGNDLEEAQKAFERGDILPSYVFDFLEKYRILWRKNLTD